MSVTYTDQSPTSGSVTARLGSPDPARGARVQRARSNNPVRISRIGSDHLQVHIRDPSGCAELFALVERLERLIDVGYDAIDVIFEHPVPDEPVNPDREQEHRRA